MLITTDIILQNVFLASIVLMAFSLPKIFIIFFWSSYRQWIFEKIPRISNTTFTGKAIHKLLPESVIKKQSGEDAVMDAISTNILSTFSEIKIPMIEAVSSVLLMIICLIFLKFDTPAVVIIILLIVLLFISIMVGAIIIMKYYGRAKPYLEKKADKENLEKEMD